MRSRGLALVVLAVAIGCAPGIRDEIELGRQFSNLVRRELPLLSDPEIRGLVVDTGKQLLAASDPQPYAYRYYVVEHADPTAFAAPGGHVYVTTGLLLAVQGSSQFAAVLAHEIGHVVHRHSIERADWARVQDQRMAQSNSRRIVPGDSFLQILSAQRAVLSYSREQEIEADAFAAAALERTGHCAYDLVTVLAALGRDGPGGGPFSSHPSTPERVEAILALGGAEACETKKVPDRDARVFAIQARILKQGREAGTAGRLRPRN